MENRSLVSQLRIVFVCIIAASIAATAVTYAAAAVLYVYAQYKCIYPANYYEMQIPYIDAFIRNKNVALFSQSGKEELQNMLSGNGIYYQAVDAEGNILYGTNLERIFDDKAELYKRFNTTFKRQNYYIYTVPVIDDDGKVLGAIALLYRLKMSYVGARGRWLIIIFVIALISPFFYILGFTMLFSRIFVNSINKPLNLLMDASQKIKERDLDFTIDYRADNELGRLCAAFSEMKDELKKSLSAQWKMEQERVEIIEALAHDLKTPLSIIRGYSEALIDANTGGSEKLLKYLSIIENNAEKCSGLVQQMLYALDLERTNVHLQPVPVEMAEFLEQKVHQYELQAKQKKIAITLNIQGGTKTPVLVDKDRLERVLDNIVSNSLEYTPAGGKINISVKIEDNNVFYEICDTGRGFSQKDMERAFDKFYRGDEARRSKTGHSGLGLFIVRHLIEQLGGSIRLGNAESGGACVTFHHKIFRDIQ
ncbi:sensor histidine kinase [Thermoclostridium stercorarium]|nr:HAMP domain-containing sensor histidine kinase [Thermoclostridium stercorarium]